MDPVTLVIVVIALAVGGYFFGKHRAVWLVDGQASRLNSLPSYHGFYVTLWMILPALAALVLWVIAEPLLAHKHMEGALPESFFTLSGDEQKLLLSNLIDFALGAPTAQTPEEALRPAAEVYASYRENGGLMMQIAVVALALAGFAFAVKRISAESRARHRVEKAAEIIMMAASAIAILTTIGIVLSLIFETLRFFAKVPFFEFLLGLNWSPQTALRADQVGSSGAFGAIPLFAGTLLITVIAMFVAVPIGLFAAIYLSEYAGPKLRALSKPALEILAGVPTVVYGFFAALTVAPAFRGVGESIGLDVSSESALAAGCVMGIMIIPFISSLSDDVMNAVPQSLRDGAYALGATKSETIRQVILPAALPGIVGAFMLAISRAIGETMIVVMAAGLAANLTANPLEAVTTVTVQIVTLLTGDQEFDSAKTLAAFALGLVLFVITLGLNAIALHVVRRYREQYD